MNKTYVIHWKSKTNGRIGTGTTRFDREEAEELVKELNRDYPEIEHCVLNVGPADEPHDTIIPLRSEVAEPVAS